MQYKNLLMEILKKGIETKSQQGVNAITLIAPKPMRFNFENGFPLITERNIKPFWLQAVGEICAFINGARTLSELDEFGCHWWKPWGSKKKCEKRGLQTGDLGPGSYGAAFHDFPTSDGGKFKQFANIIEQMKEFPHLRTHFITPWIPQYTIRGEGKVQKVVVAPCHGWIHMRIINNKLTLHMIQRSADVPVGVPANIAQYAALTLMIAHVIGCDPYEYVHSFSDAHIYVDQMDAVEEMLKRESRPFPAVFIDKNVSDLFEFRKEHFTLIDYNPHPGIKNIPVAI